MKDTLLALIVVVGIPVVGWSTLYGLRTGTIEAAGVPGASFTRSTHPFLFWMTALLNVAVCVGGAALLASGL